MSSWLRERLASGDVPDHDEELLLVLSVADKPDPELVRSVAARSTIDWDRFVERASYHGVVALVAHHLEEANLLSVLPDKTRFTLLEWRRVYTTRSLYLTGALTRYLGVLAEEGIEAVPFKGPILGHDVYHNVGLRPFGDIDLFVSRPHVMKAKAVLTKHGFMPATDRDDGEEKDLVDRQYAYSLVKTTPVGLINLEFHWTLTHRSFPFRVDVERLVRDRRTIKLGAQAVQTFSVEDTFLFLCVHGAKHYWERLIWLCDLVQIIREHEDMDWRLVVDTATASGSLRFLLLGLELTDQLFGVRVDDPAVREAMNAQPVVFALGERARDWILSAESAKGFERFGFHARLRERFRDRLPQWGQAARLTLQPSDSDRRFVELPRSLSFLYLLVRPIRVIAQQLTKRRST